VGGQGDLDFVVNVEPLGMVVHLVGLKENDSHVTINNIEHNKALTSQSSTFSRMSSINSSFRIVFTFAVLFKLIMLIWAKMKVKAQKNFL